MRIPFPERVPISSVAIFSVALFIVQRLEGTALYFASGCLVFILVSALAFNAAGGLTRVSGAYVFFYSLLVVIVGISYKAYLGEPAESNLLDPKTDIEVYVGGIMAMYLAVIISRRFRRKTGLLVDILPESGMYRASIGCMAVGVAGGFVIALLGSSGLRLATAFNQLNQLMQLGIIIGVYYEIRRSGGTRSMTLPMLIVGAYVFVAYGLVGFSKQGMLVPLVCWLAPVCALRFRLSMLQIFGSLAVAFVIFYYLVPYSQYGRRYIVEGQTFQQKVDITTRLLEHPELTRETYDSEETMGSYYNTAQGFWDRLQFVSVDDGLIQITDQGKVYGLLPIGATALNAIPHVFWPDKPVYNFGNLYSHEIGGIDEDDYSTGISFSPTAEAYHMARWTGVLVVAPLLWFLFFVVYDSLFGDLRATPWGLLVLAQLSHTSSEGALIGVVWLLTFGVEIFVFCAFFAAWVAPVFASFVLGPERTNAQPQFSLEQPVSRP